MEQWRFHFFCLENRTNLAALKHEDTSCRVHTWEKSIKSFMKKQEERWRSNEKVKIQLKNQESFGIQKIKCLKVLKRSKTPQYISYLLKKM